MVELEYAKALFELAEDEGITKTVKDEFKAVVKTSYGNEDFIKVMSSPFIQKSNKKELIKNIYGSFSNILIDFLYVLVDNDRFLLIKEIYNQFKKLILVDSNILRVLVKSTKELNANQISQIEEAIKERYSGKTIELKNVVDDGILGGIQIMIDDELFDLSIKSSLKRLKESI